MTLGNIFLESVVSNGFWLNGKKPFTVFQKNKINQYAHLVAFSTANSDFSWQEIEPQPKNAQLFQGKSSQSVMLPSLQVQNLQDSLDPSV